ncbi:hypothetical protein WJX72_007926 [[Myrmecia] bisecta]|uniref:Uncharacterized protein n=1 Tax=[Myrmecia] bisecta TaxID=41462 RepID=A0AAW1P707_9CHLO
MQQQLDAAAVVVVVLSPEFFTRKAPLEEVRSILNKQKLAGARQQICPVFHGITVEACCAMDMAGALLEYKDDIHELCEVTGIREDKTRYYQGEQAVEAVNTVIKFLKEAGCLPPDYGGGPQNRVLRMHSKLLGRDSELQQVLAYLKEHRGRLPGGAYPVDLSLADTEAPLADQVAAQLINQLGNMEGAGKLGAPPTWASLVQWLDRNDHALMVVLENVEAVIDKQKEALMQLVKDMQQCKCSIQEALADAEAGGPLSLLEGARAGGARDDHQIRQAIAWLLKHLRPQEQEAVAKLSLFRGSISLGNTLLMIEAPAERSPQLQDLMDSFILQRSPGRAFARQRSWRPF